MLFSNFLKYFLHQKISFCQSSKVKKSKFIFSKNYYYFSFIQINNFQTTPNSQFTDVDLGRIAFDFRILRS